METATMEMRKSKSGETSIVGLKVLVLAGGRSAEPASHRLHRGGRGRLALGWRTLNEDVERVAAPAVPRHGPHILIGAPA